jgi:hypothetical protein
MRKERLERQRSVCPSFSHLEIASRKVCQFWAALRHDPSWVLYRFFLLINKSPERDEEE